MTRQAALARGMWHSWHPDKMRDAMHTPIACRNRECLQPFRPMDGLDAMRHSVRCPHCTKESMLMSKLSWTPKMMSCMRCGIVAPRASRSFRQNIGLVLVRLHNEHYGVYCRTCVDKLYWRTTLISGTIGLLSPTSLLVGPFCVITNTYNYFMTLFMCGARRDSWEIDPSPRSEAAFRDMEDEIFHELRRSRDRHKVARTYAERAGLATERALPLMYEMLFDHALADEGVSNAPLAAGSVAG